MATSVRPPGTGAGSPRAGRVRGVVRRHPRTAAGIVLACIALGTFGFLWLRPDKLFVDTEVNDALPTVQVPAETGTPSTGAPVASAAVISTGRFRDLEHPTTGVAKIIRLADGKRIVRLEDFHTSSGPDVVVMLSSTPASEDGWRAYDDGAFVNLGALRGNVGAQNYTIPANVDLGRYRSVVIWFTVGFGAAPINPST